MTKTTVSAGAAAVAAGSFRLGSTMGETGVVGQVGGGSYRLIEGFWRPNANIPAWIEELPEDPTVPAVVVVQYENLYTANLPNPFHDATAISFSVKDPSPVSLAIYDVGGRRIRTLVDTTLPTGPHLVLWDGRDGQDAALASGTYFVRLAIGAWSTTKRVLRIR